MKVLIDASELYRNNTGIGRFGNGWNRYLPSTIEVVYNPPDYATRRHEPGTRTLSKRLYHFGQHVALTQWNILRSARQEQPNLIHSHSFFVPLGTNLPCVATIFDLAYFDYPAETDPVWGMYARLLMGCFARKAAAILTTTEGMRTQIAKRFGIPHSKIYRIVGGVDPQFQTVSDIAQLETIRLTYNLKKPFVLYVGAWHGTKNLPTLIEAFQNISDAELILTGSPHSAEEAKLITLAQSLKVPARFIGFVPDIDLPALYTLAQVVVQPSLYEGYGLPVLEAMACGTPVIISDIPTFREVAGNAALYFPPRDYLQLREHLDHLLRNPQDRAVWSVKTRAYAARFRWENTARQIAAVWGDVVA